MADLLPDTGMAAAIILCIFAVWQNCLIHL